MRALGGYQVPTLSGAQTLSASRVGAGGLTTAASAFAVSGMVPITHAWTKISGTTLTVDSPTALNTTFTRTMGAGDSTTSVYRLTSTDAAGNPVTRDITITLDASAVPMGGAISPDPVSGSRVGAGTVTSSGMTAVATGRSGPFTYAWSCPYASANSPAAATTTWSKFLAAGTDVPVTVQCDITNTPTGETVTLYGTVNFHASAPAALSVGASPNPAVSDGAYSPYGDVSDLVTVGVSGGTPGYTFSAAYVSGSTFLNTFAGSGNTGRFYRAGADGSYTGVQRITVTDSLGVVGTFDITVQLDIYTGP